MDRKEAFMRWVAETFGDPNGWYTVGEGTLKEIKRDWEEWEGALMAWGILDGDEEGEELYQKLKSLPPEKIRHIGEALYREYG